MNPNHDVYRMPTPAAVAAVVAGCGWHAAVERWGHRLCMDSLVRLERQGRRPGREVGIRVRREAGEHLRCSVDPRWDRRAFRLSPERASDLTGVPTPAFRERIH